MLTIGSGISPAGGDYPSFEVIVQNVVVPTTFSNLALMLLSNGSVTGHLHLIPNCPTYGRTFSASSLTAFIARM
jgi:hypothetical protein